MTNNPVRELVALISKSPDLVEVTDLRTVKIEMARGSKKRPAYLKLPTSDEVIKALRGPAGKAECEVFVVVVLKEARERLESRIIRL